MCRSLTLERNMRLKKRRGRDMIFNEKLGDLMASKEQKYA